MAIGCGMWDVVGGHYEVVGMWPLDVGCGRWPL